MTIYYAHHRWKYNTDIENYEIGLIQKWLPPAQIINPNGHVNQNQSEEDAMRDCFEAIKASDVLVFSSVSGIVGRGVYDEVHFAKELHKTVLYINKNRLCYFKGTLERVLTETDRVYAVVKED